MSIFSNLDCLIIRRIFGAILFWFMMSYVQYAISQLSMYESLFVVLRLSSAQVPECFFLSFYPGVYAYPMVPNPTHYASRLSYGMCLRSVMRKCKTSTIAGQGTSHFSTLPSVWGPILGVPIGIISSSQSRGRSGDPMFCPQGCKSPAGSAAPIFRPHGSFQYKDHLSLLSGSTISCCAEGSWLYLNEL